MPKFRKKPVVIEAVQVTKETFTGPHPNPEHLAGRGILYDPMDKVVRIETYEGLRVARIGDWIITGVKDEKYPCKPDIFAATYEPVDESEIPAGPKVGEVWWIHCSEMYAVPLRKAKILGRTDRTVRLGTPTIDFIGSTASRVDTYRRSDIEFVEKAE